MKNLKLSLFYFGLMLLASTGCIDDSEDKKVEELESIIRQTGILDGNMDLGNLDRSHTKTLFESIHNKEILIPQTYKVMGLLYLNLATSDQALNYLDKYLEAFPKDGETLFYKGIIMRQNQKDYCEYFRRAKELDFELTREIEFTYNLENDPCI